MQRDGRRGRGTHAEHWRKRFERDRRLRSALDELLVPQEAVAVVAYGEAGSAVVGTRARVLVFKRGIKAGVPFGHRLKAFAYESMVSVNLRRAGDEGVLVIHAPLRAGSCAVYWIDERDDAWKARNVLVVPKASLDAYEPVVQTLRDLAASHQERHGSATPAGEPRIEPAPPTGPHRVCSACGAEASGGWRYCPACGASFDETVERLRLPRAERGSRR